MVIIPRAAFTSPLWDKLTKADADVYLGIASHADADYRCWPSITRIAKLAQVSERTAQRSVSRLCKIGLLIRESGGGRGPEGKYQSNRYRLTIPDEAVRDGTPTSHAVNPDEPRHLTPTNSSGEQIIEQTKEQQQGLRCENATEGEDMGPLERAAMEDCRLPLKSHVRAKLAAAGLSDAERSEVIRAAMEGVSANAQAGARINHLAEHAPAAVQRVRDRHAADMKHRQAERRALDHLRDMDAARVKANPAIDVKVVQAKARKVLQKHRAAAEAAFDLLPADSREVLRPIWPCAIVNKLNGRGRSDEAVEAIAHSPTFAAIVMQWHENSDAERAVGIAKLKEALGKP